MPEEALNRLIRVAEILAKDNPDPVTHTRVQEILTLATIIKRELTNERN